MVEWRYSSTFLDALATLPLGERAPSTHWIGGWVGPRFGMDAVEERKFCTAGNRTWAVQP
jgi:hypothetical protein